MPTYGTGRVLQEARNATVNKTYNNNPLYGDDRIVDDDNGLQELTISFESTGLSDADRIAVLGEEQYGTSGVSGQWVTDAETPWGGFGFVRRMRDGGVKKFEAYWTLKLKFQEESQATSTREGAISWGTPTLNGRAASLYVDSSDNAKFQLHKTFTTATDAKNWLKTLANIT
jgi:hypothetical protein